MLHRVKIKPLCLFASLLAMSACGQSPATVLKAQWQGLQAEVTLEPGVSYLRENTVRIVGHVTIRNLSTESQRYSNRWLWLQTESGARSRAYQDSIASNVIDTGAVEIGAGDTLSLSVYWPFPESARADLVPEAFTLTLAQTIELVRVEDSLHNQCADAGCMYDEWFLEGNEAIHLVISGYEDGSDAELFRVSDDGGYQLLLHIRPIVMDAAGDHWWGYPDTLRAIPVTEVDGTMAVYATFDSAECDDGNHARPPWQRAIPVVLFFGEKRGWNAERKRYDYRPRTIASLIEEAKSTDTYSRNPVEHCGGSGPPG